MVKLSTWATQHRLAFSPDKTKWSLLKGKVNPDRHLLKVRYEGTEIERVYTQRYLGVEVSEGLKIGPHIDRVTVKAKKAFQNFTTVAQANWGLNYRTIKALYQGIFVPIVPYAVGVWYPMVSAQYHKNRLVSAQRLLLIAMTKDYRTVSTEAMQVIAGVLPLGLALKERYLIEKESPAARTSKL